MTRAGGIGGSDPVVRRIRLVAWVGLVVNLLLAAAKLAAGVLGRSQAVVADGVHSLSDLVSDVALIVGVRYWMAPADDHHPHGHRRIETVVTVSIGVLLAVVALGLAETAVKGLVTGPRPIPSPVALVAALVSIIVKEVLFWWTLMEGRRLQSEAVVANAWHHRSDALSSIPAALAVLLARLEPGWAFVDSVGALIVCLLVLVAAFKIVHPALAQLVDTAAPEKERLELERLARGVAGVVSAHALRTRYTGSKLAVDLHVEVDGELSVRQGHGIGEAVRQRLLAEGPNVVDVLVKVEPVKQSAREPGA